MTRSLIQPLLSEALPHFKSFDPTSKLEWRDDIAKRLIVKPKDIRFTESE